MKDLIKQGNIDCAEALVDKDYDEQLVKEDKSLPQKYYERGSVKQLKLKYKVALESFEKAAKLQSENAFYANKTCTVAYTLGKYDKAIGYNELAFNTFENVLGTEHPNTKVVLKNLNDTKLKQQLKNDSNT